MKTYDLIAVGTGSAMTVVEAYLQMHPRASVAVIDKDPPGGICLTKGCMPTKMLVYPAEILRSLESAAELGLEGAPPRLNFARIMQRMRRAVDTEVERIRSGLENAKPIDYYPRTAEFVKPYTLRVGEQTIRSGRILLCTGSRPAIPPIRNLERVRCRTSDTVLDLTAAPRRLAIVGGGYVAAEYGHFFSAVGTAVTIIGRNPRFLPEEEPEVSALAAKTLGRHLRLLTGCRAVAVAETAGGEKQLTVAGPDDEAPLTVTVDEILLAAGRAPNTDLLQPQRGGIETDAGGWIVTDDYLETTQPGVWALGDANGRHLFKHVANYEAQVVYSNALLKEKIKADYHAVPHAVFTHPEVAAVGLGETAAVGGRGADGVLIGFHRFGNTTRGEAMGLKEDFVKVIVDRRDQRILGAHIIGPQASVLIQEVVNLMYTPQRTIAPILTGMHIHPSLSEVVERAFLSLMPQPLYRERMDKGML